MIEKQHNNNSKEFLKKVLIFIDSTLINVVASPEKEKETKIGEYNIDEGDYEEFFQKAMKKFGIKSPAELDDEEKKKFFNYVDANYKAKSEED